MLSTRWTPLSDRQRTLLELSTDNWEVIYAAKTNLKSNVSAPHDSKLQIFRFCSVAHRVYTFTHLDHKSGCEHLLVMNVWFYKEKVIPLFCYRVRVFAVLYKFNRHVFIANEFNFTFLKLLASHCLDSLWARQSGPVLKVSTLEIVDCIPKIDPNCSYYHPSNPPAPPLHKETSDRSSLPSIISCELIYGCPGAGPELGYLAPELAASSTAAAAAAAAGPPTLDPAVEKCKLPTLEDGRWPLDTPDPDIWVDPIPNGVGSFPGG